MADEKPTFWGKVRNWSGKLPGRAGALFGATFSPFLLLMGYGLGNLVHPLLGKVSLTTPPAASVGWCLLALVIAGGIMFVPEFQFINDSDSPKREIQKNAMIDIAVGFALGGVGCILTWENAMPWWYLPGLAFSVANAFASSWFGMNTLFSKNPTQFRPN